MKCKKPNKKIPVKQCEYARHPACPEWQREEKWQLDHYRKLMKEPVK